MRLIGCSIGYSKGKVLFHSLNYEFKPALYIIDGPNGSGKSTLLRTLCGVLKPLAGAVTVAGADVYAMPAIRSRISYLPHRLGGQASLRVRDYLRFWNELRKDQRAEEERRGLAAAFGLDELADSKMGNLSRGQTQRVAVLKTLSVAASILILDEPFTGLDTHHTNILASELDARRDEGTTVILSQHGPHKIRDSAHTALDIQTLGKGGCDE